MIYTHSGQAFMLKEGTMATQQGSLALLDDPVAQKLLQSAILCASYLASSATKNGAI